MVSKLEIEVATPDPRTLVCTLSGSLHGTAQAYAFQEDVQNKISAGSNHVVLDLGGLQRIDSSGLGILIALMYAASSAGGRLILASAQERITKALGIALLLDRIERADSTAEALARLSES